MSLDLAAEIWTELKRYLDEVDRPDAADSLVHLLVDNDHDAGEIRIAFKNDADVKSALKGYMDELSADESESDEDEDEDDDEDDDY